MILSYCLFKVLHGNFKATETYGNNAARLSVHKLLPTPFSPHNT